jgi:hypothetical protein
MFVGHKIFLIATETQSAQRSEKIFFSVFSVTLWLFVFTFKNKKAPTHDEKGRQNGCALLIFPKLMMLELELAPDIETKVQSVAVVSSGQSLDHSS